MDVQNYHFSSFCLLDIHTCKFIILHAGVREVQTVRCVGNLSVSKILPGYIFLASFLGLSSLPIFLAFKLILSNLTPHMFACWDSQELLDGVEQERHLRLNPARNATIFHHPTLGDFELQHVC